MNLRHRSVVLGAFLFCGCAAQVTGVSGETGEPGEAVSSSGVGPGSPTTWYVATTGDDAADGSLGRPWRTLQHAVDASSNGATIVVRGGTYVERVSILAAGGPLVIKPAEGERVIVDGTDAAPGQCAVFRIVGRRGVTLRGLTMRNAKKVDGSTRCDNTFGVPITTAVEIRDGASDIVVVKNEILHIDRVATVPHSIAAPIVIGSQGLAPTHHVVIADNEIHDCAASAPGPKSNAISVRFNVTGFAIQRNRISAFQGSGIAVAGSFPRVTLPEELDAARNGVVEANIIEGAPGHPTLDAEEGHGLYVNGARDILFHRNHVKGKRQGMGIVTEPGPGTYVTQRIWVRDNLFTQIPNNAFSMGGWEVLDDPTPYRAIQDVHVTNNTFHGVHAGGPLVTLRHSIRGDSRFWNNIVVAEQPLLSRYVAPGDTLSLRNNVYWSSRYPKAFWSCGPAGDCGARIDLDAFKLRHGETNSVFADPAFRGPPTSAFGFGITSASPAWQAGSPGTPLLGNFGPYAPACELDFFGGRRFNGAVDVGAHEL